jgi:hypothetical protein
MRIPEPADPTTFERALALKLPSDPTLLEEVNLPSTLATSLAGQTVAVRVLPEEEPGTRRVDPSVESSAMIDPPGAYGNAFQPVRVLFTDPSGGVWRFPRRWLNPVAPEPKIEDSPVFQPASWEEEVNLPSEWDLQELNIEPMLAHLIAGRVAIVEVRVSPDEPVKVLRRNASGGVWRIPRDWRRRRIQLPSRDVLVSQDIPPEVAEEFAGKIVSVNYHPASICCLPDAYRFRDREGNRWPVKINDVVLLGYGDGTEHVA